MTDESREEQLSDDKREGLGRIEIRRRAHNLGYEWRAYNPKVGWIYSTDANYPLRMDRETAIREAMEHLNPAYGWHTPDQGPFVPFSEGAEPPS